MKSVKYSRTGSDSHSYSPPPCADGKILKICLEMQKDLRLWQEEAGVFERGEAQSGAVHPESGAGHCAEMSGECILTGG